MICRRLCPEGAQAPSPLGDVSICSLIELLCTTGGDFRASWGVTFCPWKSPWGVTCCSPPGVTVTSWGDLLVTLGGDFCSVAALFFCNSRHIFVIWRLISSWSILPNV